MVAASAVDRVDPRIAKPESPVAAIERAAGAIAQIGGA
jgi:hypothetical protein